METVKIFPNVHLGAGVTIEDWVVIGLPPRGVAPGALETVIEDGAVIRSNSVIYAGSRIGANFKTGHRIVLGPGLEIGANCSVGNSTVFMGYTRLEDGARVHGHCTVGAFTVIQPKAWVGPYCLFNSQVDTPPVVAAGAILGARVYISPGVRIGERALVGAGVKLTQDVQPYRLVAGNPARGLRDIARLNCPYQLIERPYEPDELALQAEVKARHQVKSPEEYATNTWRHDLWRKLGSPHPMQVI